MAHDADDELLAARFGEASNLRVYVTRAAMENGATVDFVEHDSEGDWWFMHPLPEGQDRFTADDVAKSCLACLLRVDTGLVEIADLPRGWLAHREDDGTWTREPAPDDEGDEPSYHELEGFVRIRVSLPEGGNEGLWASPVGGDRYRLENAPWFATGLNWHDVVRCEPNPEYHDATSFVAEVVERGGETSFLLIVGPRAPEEALKEILGRIEEHHAGFKWAELDEGQRRYAITADAESDWRLLAGYFAETAARFDFVRWRKNSAD
jgi:hypothetical protein